MELKIVMNDHCKLLTKSGVKKNSKSALKSTGPEKFSTGPEYRNGGNKIC
jgi:hypothetical protein